MLWLWYSPFLVTNFASVCWSGSTAVRIASSAIEIHRSPGTSVRIAFVHLDNSWAQRSWAGPCLIILPTYLPNYLETSRWKKKKKIAKKSRAGVKWRCDVAVTLQLTQIGAALFFNWRILTFDWRRLGNTGAWLPQPQLFIDASKTHPLTPLQQSAKIITHATGPAWGFNEWYSIKCNEFTRLVRTRERFRNIKHVLRRTRNTGPKYECTML
jgi:hypothetical protein